MSYRATPQPVNGIRMKVPHVESNQTNQTDVDVTNIKSPSINQSMKDDHVHESHERLSR